MEEIIVRSPAAGTVRRSGHIAARARAPRETPPGAVAQVTGLNARGAVLVQVPGLPGPSVARMLKGVRREDLFDSQGVGEEVLLAFDGGCLNRPIIIGILEREQPDTEEPKRAEFDVVASGSRKERVFIEALAELVLKCGAGSITLRKDGKIVLRGTHLLSRASGPIRIKGGHVEIN